MGLFNKKSAFAKDQKEEKKAARKKARKTKKAARQTAREEKKDARQDKRAAEKTARKTARAEKKDARQDKRAAKKEIRQSGLKGKDKRTAKKQVRQTTRSRVKDAKDQKKTTKKIARQTKRDQVHAAKTSKRATVKKANTTKRETLKTLRIPRAIDRKWVSYLRFQEFRAKEIFKPKNLDDLKTICRIATENKMEVRAVGSGHSFSEITHCKGVLVETKKFDKMLPFAQAARRRRLKRSYHGRAGSKLVEFEVGRTIINLSKSLEPKKLALANQGTYDGQTFWGAVSTSTHGSGISRAAFPAMVKSVVLVGEGGRTYRIEPSDGITNPENWRESGIDELIQNDHHFKSVICSMGCFGIVYSAIIEARDFYWFDEWTFITTWDTFKTSFSNRASLRRLLDNYDSVSLLVAPSKANKGKKDGVSLAGEYPTSLELRRETKQRRVIGGTGMDRLAKTFENLNIITGKAPAEGRWYRPKLANLKRDDSWMARFVSKNGGKVGWNGEPINANQVPIKRRNKCYKLFPKGGKLFGGYGIELAFPYHRTVEVMDRIIRLVAANEEDKMFHTAPVAIRFVAPTDAYASPQYRRETVMFEVLMAKGNKGGVAALKLIEEAMLKEPDVRVHWGLSTDRMTADNVDLTRMYPQWRRWMSSYRFFNANGTFSNKFTRRLGLD